MTKPKWRKMAEDSPQFQKLANNLARSAIHIDQCRKCWHPVINGYCCPTCGTGTPQTTEAEDAAYEKRMAKKMGRT